MRSFGQLWPTLKRLLKYGSPWRKPLAIAVVMLWVAAAAEVSGPLLISYFIDNMVAKNNLPLAMVAGSLLAGVVYSFLSPMTLREGLAISAGFGWYTLAPSVISGAGHAVAGAVSFLHNVLRETLGIILLPLAASKIGCIEAVTLPGTCAMDVCLPIVERSCSAETLPYTFTTGMAACLFSALLVPLIMGV